jgi:hypothetical protein
MVEVNDESRWFNSYVFMCLYREVTVLNFSESATPRFQYVTPHCPITFGKLARCHSSY